MRKVTKFSRVIHKLLTNILGCKIYDWVDNIDLTADLLFLKGNRTHEKTPVSCLYSRS
jgi:hypothetical protein